MARGVDPEQKTGRFVKTRYGPADLLFTGGSFTGSIRALPKRGLSTRRCVCDGQILRRRPGLHPRRVCRNRLNRRNRGATATLALWCFSIPCGMLTGAGQAPLCRMALKKPEGVLDIGVNKNGHPCQKTGCSNTTAQLNKNRRLWYSSNSLKPGWLQGVRDDQGSDSLVGA